VDQIVNLQDRPDIARLVKGISKKRRAYIADPGYRAGREVTVGWDGGSRDQWYVVYAAGRRVEPLGLARSPNGFNDPFGQRHVLPEWPAGADAVVMAGTFCGKPATPTVYLPPAASATSGAPIQSHTDRA
jgi:hypothetical protein